MSQQVEKVEIEVQQVGDQWFAWMPFRLKVDAENAKRGGPTKWQAVQAAVDYEAQQDGGAQAAHLNSQNG